MQQLYDECAPDEQAGGRTSSKTNCFWDDHGQIKKVVCIIAPIDCYGGQRYFRLKVVFLRSVP